MEILLNWAENTIRDFDIWDIAIFKIYLFSVGLIFGAYFSNFIKKKIWWVAAIAVLSSVWMVYKMFS